MSGFTVTCDPNRDSLYLVSFKNILFLDYRFVPLHSRVCPPYFLILPPSFSVSDFLTFLSFRHFSPCPFLVLFVSLLIAYLPVSHVVALSRVVSLTFLFLPPQPSTSTLSLPLYFSGVYFPLYHCYSSFFVISACRLRFSLLPYIIALCPILLPF